MRKKIALLAVASLLVAPFAATGLASKSYAASLTDVTVNLTGTPNVDFDPIVVIFTAATPLANGTILEIAYPGGLGLDLFRPENGDMNWLIPDSGLSVTGTNISTSADTHVTQGLIRSVITTTNSGADSSTGTITITIGREGYFYNPTTRGNYSWSVTANIGGAGTTYDSGAGLAYVGDENDVTVSAVVPPVIDMELYVAGSDTLLSNPNACALGVLSLAQVNSCTYDVGYGTNNTSGMTVKVVRDAALDNGANDINDLADTAVTAGAEEYGFTISDIGTGCSASAASTYASQDNAVPGAAATFFSNTATCNGTTSGQAAKRAEVTHKASMDASTVVGSYAQVVTYTAFTN